VAAKPWVVSDSLWERIEPLLPRVERRFRYPGRKRLPHRQALQGIPGSAGCICRSSSATAVARPAPGGWSSGSRRAWDSKYHLLVGATGIPLAWTVTGGNRNDVTQLIPLVERVPQHVELRHRPRRLARVPRSARASTASVRLPGL
jgi:hypothetical protein